MIFPVFCSGLVKYSDPFFNKIKAARHIKFMSRTSEVLINQLEATLIIGETNMTSHLKIYGCGFRPIFRCENVSFREGILLPLERRGFRWPPQYKRHYMGNPWLNPKFLSEGLPLQRLLSECVRRANVSNDRASHAARDACFLSTHPELGGSSHVS